MPKAPRPAKSNTMPVVTIAPQTVRKVTTPLFIYAPKIRFEIYVPATVAATAKRKAFICDLLIIYTFVFELIEMAHHAPVHL